MPALLLWLALQDPQEDEIRRLVDLLGSESLADRESATEKLIGIGEPARKHLQPMAEESGSELQERARFILNRIDAKARREALLKRGTVPPELLKRDPALVDRIASKKSEDRERAFEQITGISMDEVRELPENRRNDPHYHLPSLTCQALLAEFPDVIREILRLGSERPNKVWNFSWVERLDSPFLRRILLESLDDSDADLRACAAYYCGVLKIAEAATKLETLLKDDNGRGVAYAISSLGILGSRSTAPAIAGFLGHEIPSIRRSALTSAARLGYREAVPVFRTILQRKPPDETAADAAYALLQFPDPADLDLWVELSKSDDGDIQAYAVEALDRIPGEKSTRALIELLEAPDHEVSKSSACFLARRRAPRAADRVEAAIDRIGEDTLFHAPLVYALRDLPDDDREARFRRLLENPRSTVRRAALHAIGDLRLNALAMDVVAKLREDEGLPAAAALLRLDYSDSGALRKILSALSSSDVHRLVALKIVRIEAPQARERLLADPDPEIRRAALSELDDEAIEGRIAPMLADEDPGVAAVAVRRARMSNLREIASKLILLLDDQTPDPLFSEAVRTLGEWKERGAIPRLVPFLPHDEVAIALGRLNAVEAEAEILKHLDGNHAVTSVAGRLRLEKALAPLRERMVLRGDLEAASAYVAIRCGQDTAKVMASLRDEDEMVRLGAIRQLGERNAREAVNALRDRLDDPSHDVAVEAATLLVRWGDKSRKTLRFVKDLVEDGAILLDLNGLRNPEALRALISKELELWITGRIPTSEAAALFEDPLGTEVRISAFALAHESGQSFAYLPAEYLLSCAPLLLEKDQVVVLDWVEAKRFWSEWIDRELKE